MIETELIKTGDVQFNTLLSCILIIQNGIKDEACVPFQFLNLKKNVFFFWCSFLYFTPVYKNKLTSCFLPRVAPRKLSIHRVSVL